MKEAWNHADPAQYLHNQNIMSFSLQCFCFSAIPASNLTARGMTIPAAVTASE